MNPRRRSRISRWGRHSQAALALLVAWPALAQAGAPAEDTLARAIRGVLSPGEGQAGEAIFASARGAASEAELPLVARARYSFKRPRVRVEITDQASKTLRLLVYDGKEAWLITQVGATRLAEVAPDVRRALGEQAFPLGITATGARLVGTETIAGRPAQVIEGTGPEGAWGMWVDAAEGRLWRYRLRGGEQTGELSYGSGGVLRRVVVKNAQGRIVLARFRDVPVKLAVEDSVFSFEQAKGGADLGQALARGLTAGRTQGPAVTATAGARGVDEEVQRRQLGQMRLDYQALAEVERFRVSDAEVESFMRAGKLGRYRE
jgi:outer membrane lipoprotein-sorting protein